ncbi:MAG: cell division protein FtsA [Planktomarina sp.]
MSVGFAQFQKALRTMRSAAMQRGVVAILDVGTSKLACLILRFDGAAVGTQSDEVGSLAGHSGFRVIGAATTRSRGVRFGEVESMNETERAIRTAVQAAQKMAGVRVDHLVACLSGAYPRSYGVTGQTDVMSETVSQEDVGQVFASCDVPDFGAGRTVLHAQPVNFELDHKSGLQDPVGHRGETLTADLHMLTVEDTVIHNLAYCIRRCDMELAGVAASPYVAALSSLVEDEQELGAACIDLGGGASSLSIFLKRHMIYADSVRMGGDHVTSDISMGLQVPMATAERIKTFYGGVLATGMDDREMIDLDGNSGDWEHDRRQVSRSDLIGIIRPRIEEILESVRDRLDAAGFEQLPGRQIVLTGGGSQVPGIDGLATRILGQNVRLGRPVRVQGLPQAATGPAFSAAVGLALFTALPQDEWWDFDVPDQRTNGRTLRRAFEWFRNNW